MSLSRRTFASSLCLAVLTLVLCQLAVFAEPDNKDTGRTSIDLMADQYLREHPEVKWLRDCDKRDDKNNPIPGHVDPALVKGAGPYGTLYPPTAASAMGFDTESKLYEGMYYAGLNQLGGFNGQVNSDLKSYTQELQAGDFMARTLQYPPNVANQAKAQAIGQSQALSNAMGDIAKSQSASAISYCSSFLQNFTTDEGNRWNKIRNGLFMPIAILLLLPGAVMTQVKAMAVSGNPVLSDSQSGESNPLEGILRSVVAIFLIPATYLVVNYGIDFSNCIIDSIAGTYKNVMGTNMYQDALSNEVRAFPVRTPRENQNAGTPRVWPTTTINSVEDFEKNYLINKVEDPSEKKYEVPKNKTDEAMPSGAVAARQLSFGANAALTAAWNVLCAFQMAYLSYLFFVGPIAAALWVWPMKHFRNALPNWIEGVVTLCFWSLFWNTAILLMACFNGVNESSTMITSALNFLATSSVKFAFDFAGLVRAAGQEAAKKATERAGAAGKSGGSGNDGKGAQKQEKKDTALTNAVASESATNAVTTKDSGTVVTNNDSTSLVSNTKASDLNNATSSFLIDGITPPPLAISSQNGANWIQSQSVQLGNYTVSRGVDDQGKPHDLLKTSNGQVIAELPPDSGNGHSFTADGVKLTCRNDANGSSYSLTEASGALYTAQLPSLEGRTASAIVGGSLSPDGDLSKDSIALRSTEGTMLLENGGNTVLMPCSNGNGYDAYRLEAGVSEGNFALMDGRRLSLSQNPDGSRQVSIGSENGDSESFNIKSNGAGGFDISHELDGMTASSSNVSTDGNTTVYSNYDANGKLTDVDRITGSNIASTLYDPATEKVLGFVNSSYEDNGNSQTSYYQPDGTLTASTSHVFKADGGFIDTVTDGSGDTVSIQEKTPTQGGGYALQSSSFYDGQVISANISNYDSNSNLIATSAVEPTTVATFERNSNLVVDAASIAQGIPQSNQNGTVYEVAQGVTQTNQNGTVYEAAQVNRESQPVSAVTVVPNLVSSVTMDSGSVSSSMAPALIHDGFVSSWVAPVSIERASVSNSLSPVTMQAQEYAATAQAHQVQQTTQAFEQMIRTAQNCSVESQVIADQSYHSVSPTVHTYQSADIPQPIQQIQSSRHSSQTQKAYEDQAHVGQARQMQIATTLHAQNTVVPRSSRTVDRNTSAPIASAFKAPMFSAQPKDKGLADVPMFVPSDREPQYLSKTGVDEEDCQSLNQQSDVQPESLQQQLTDAGNNVQRARTIADILHCASSTNDRSEALANTHVNYTLLCSMLQKGLTYQAQQLVNVVERDIQTLAKQGEAAPLINSYIELLTRHGMYDQANSFQTHLNSGNLVYSGYSNPW